MPKPEDEAQREATAIANQWMTQRILREDENPNDILVAAIAQAIREAEKRGEFRSRAQQGVRDADDKP